MIEKIKCWFGYHDEIREIVFKSAYQETVNYTCKHCGNAYGCTSFGTFIVNDKLEIEWDGYSGVMALQGVNPCFSPQVYRYLAK